MYQKLCEKNLKNENINEFIDKKINLFKNLYNTSKNLFGDSVDLKNIIEMEKQIDQLGGVENYFNVINSKYINNIQEVKHILKTRNINVDVEKLFNSEQNSMKEMIRLEIENIKNKLVEILRNNPNIDQLIRSLYQILSEHYLV